jgi:hypothetical protein
MVVPGGNEVSMAEDQADVAIEVKANSYTDDEELAELTSRLRAELLELDVEAVKPASAEQAPPDSKGIGSLAIGGLIVRFVLRPDTLRGLVSAVRSWAGRQRACSLRLTLDGDSLEITGPRSAEQERLIDLWIARHAGSE